MARFYGVSVEEYRAGQVWARQHLEQVRAKGSKLLASLEEPWWEKFTKAGD